MTRTQIQLNVGESFVGGQFCAIEADVARAEHVRLMSNEAELGAHDVSALRGNLAAVANVPGRVVVDLAIAQMCDRFRKGSAEVRTFGVANIREYGRGVRPGEPLELLCTVGFRGRSRDGGVFVTMFMEVRRRNGATALKFEVGVGVDARVHEGDMAVSAPRRRGPVAAA